MHLTYRKQVTPERKVHCVRAPTLNEAGHRVASNSKGDEVLGFFDTAEKARVYARPEPPQLSRECRRPYVTELRAVERLMNNKVTRREELDAASGKPLSRMETLGLIADERPTEKQSANPPRLSDDVRFSLLLDELPPQRTEPSDASGVERSAAEAPSE